MQLRDIFSRLWQDYTSQNPYVKRVYDLFIEEGEIVLNDHIAFRTFDHPAINIDILARVFVKNGYEAVDKYYFPDKKLNAKHYEHKSNPELPKIFISELITSEFSTFLQQTVNKIVKAIPEDIINSDELIFAGACWGNLSYETYRRLRDESEFASWLYYSGFCANHFTINVNALKKYDTLEKVNELLKQNGFKINDSGGEIKGSRSQLLEQSSIKAENILVKFLEGEYAVPGCYYEFAKRYPDRNGKLFTGFIATSADKIFESTNVG